MLGKRILLLVVAGLLFAGSGWAAGNYAAQLKAAQRLCTGKQFEQAEQAYRGMLGGQADAERRFEVSRKLAAVLAVQEGKEGQAKAVVEGILRDYADHGRLSHAIGEIAESCRKYGQAGKPGEIYAQMLRDKPGRADAIWLVMGHAVAQVYAEGIDAAQENVDKLLNGYSDDGRADAAIGQVARCCLNIKDYENARKLYQHVTARRPESSAAKEAYAGLARICIAEDDLQGGKDIAGRLLENAEENISGTCTALFDIGMAYYSEAARIQFKNEPDGWEVLQREAIDVWASLMKLAESHEVGSEMLAHAYHFSGHTHRSLGQYAEAAKCYEVVLGRWPDYRYAGESQHALASCLDAMSVESDANGADLEAVAEEAYKAVISKYPGCSMVGWANLHLARMYERNGRGDEAIEYYKNAIAVGTLSDFVTKSINENIAGLSGQGSEQSAAAVSGDRDLYPVPARIELMRRFRSMRDKRKSIYGQVSNDRGENVERAVLLVYSGDKYVEGGVSAKDGSYSVEELPAGTYDMHVIADGYQDRIAKGISVGADGSVEKDITLEEEGVITGLVTKSDGVTPVEDVSVWAEDSSGFSELGITDANGLYRIGTLPSGTYTVSAMDDEGEYSFPDRENVRVVSGQTTSNINFGGDCGKIAGTITGSNGSTPPAGCMVCAIDSIGDTAAIDRADESGKFELSALTAGPYTVVALYKKSGIGMIPLVKRVSVTNGETTSCDLAVGSLSGIFRDWKQGFVDETSLRVLSFWQNMMFQFKERLDEEALKTEGQLKEIESGMNDPNATE